MTAVRSGLTIECKVHFARAQHGRKRLVVGDAPAPVAAPVGRIPHVSRLMALAIRIEHLIANGEIRDYTEAAALGHVTRARMTQIMNLLCLAPNIQEALLFLQPVDSGRDPLTEWMVRPIAATPEWRRQRRMWGELHSQARNSKSD